MTLKQLTAADIDIELTSSPEETPILGNAIASGNEAADCEVEEGIRHALEEGNEWAWCSVRVKGTYKGILEAEDHLGCCSYGNEEEFRTPGGYYDDMVQTVVDLINEQRNAVAS